MKFYALEEVPAYRDDQVFKSSSTGKAIAAVIMYGLAIAALAAAISGGKPLGIPFKTFYFFAVVIALFGLIPLSLFRASLKPTNWLLRCNSSGIIIKYRAFENWRFPAGDVQAVGFDYAEIAWVKMVKERRTSPGNDRNATEISFLTYVDLGLVNAETSGLEKRLETERNLRPDGLMVSLDYPVQVLPGGVMELSWSGGIRPSARKAVGFLGRQVKIVETEHRKTDLTHHRKANADEERAKIVMLVKSGQELAAVKLTRQVYGYSLSEATEFVDKLQSGDGSPAEETA